MVADAHRCLRHRPADVEGLSDLLTLVVRDAAGLAAAVKRMDLAPELPLEPAHRLSLDLRPRGDQQAQRTGNEARGAARSQMVEHERHAGKRRRLAARR